MVVDVSSAANRGQYLSPGASSHHDQQLLLPVAVVSAIDRDDSHANAAITYRIIANNSDSQYFSIAPSTGQLSLNMAYPMHQLTNR